MAINVTFYFYRRENIRVNKNYGLSEAQYTVTDIQLNEGVDLHNPEFILEIPYSAAIEPYWNYAKISLTGDDAYLGRANRYYYCKVLHARDGIINVRFNIDVLMTYLSDIHNSAGILKRASVTKQNDMGNSYMFDRNQPKQVDYEFSSEVLYSFNYPVNGCIVLGVVGSTLGNEWSR